MGAVLHFPSCFTFNKQPKLGYGKPIFSLREIADGSSPFASHKAAPFQLTISSIKSDGNRRGRPPRKSSTSGSTKKTDQNKKSSDSRSSNSSNQEEIISLFKRIQSSISKGSTKERNSKPSEKKPSSESVLDILSQSRKDVAERSSKKEDENKLKWRRGVPRKEQQIPNKAPAVDFKLTRLPSNFVKRSPVRSPSTPRGKVLGLKIEASANIARSKELPAVENLKLPELKELAKDRGIKGYSRLKKSELVELLRSY